MKIRNLEIKGYAALAPMAGVADRAMREICANHGAAYTVGELASARGITLGDGKSKELLYCDASVCPSANQLFGSNPDFMADAAKEAVKYSPSFIDINMGCPAPKVSGHGGGSGLMKEPKLAGEIVKAVVDAVCVPVTVKMRTGWDETNLNAPELAKICEASGAAAITVHGRTKRQMYAPPIDYETIKKVKKAVKIPVIANGDINNFETAKEMFEKTECDFLMVGRGAMGNPFVFEEINAGFEGKIFEKPSLEKRFETLIEQIKLMEKYKGPRIAFLEARKHTAWYLTGLKGAAALRKLCGEISNIDGVYKICEKALEVNR